MNDFETQVADKLAEFFSDPIDIPCCYCEASKVVIHMVKQEIFDWLVTRRKKLKEKASLQAQSKPKDLQSVRVASIKARALQEVITHLKQ